MNIKEFVFRRFSSNIYNFDSNHVDANLNQFIRYSKMSNKPISLINFITCKRSYHLYVIVDDMLYLHWTISDRKALIQLSEQSNIYLIPLKDIMIVMYWNNQDRKISMEYWNLLTLSVDYIEFVTIKDIKYFYPIPREQIIWIESQLLLEKLSI